MIPLKKNSMDTLDTFLLRKTEFVEERGGTRVEQFFVRSQTVVSRRVAGETLVVPVRGRVGDLASIYSFNQAGSLIWQSLESPKGFAELVSIVEQEYAVEHDLARRDVKQFLHDLLSADLVQARERVPEEAGEEISMAGIDSTAQGELHATGSR
jgi:Coenzyme PQQ synthesis protein D (PqqD)